MTRRSQRPAAAAGSTYPGQPASRRQIMLDQPVQGLLLGRATVYWLFCLLTYQTAQWAWLRWNDPTSPTWTSLVATYWPAAAGSLLALPLVWFDLLRVSHRFVGPVASVRNALKRVELGDRLPPLQTRQGDLWRDLIERFNQTLPRPRA
jgi:hypothetical protein